MNKGENVVIGKNVRLGNDCQIGNNVVIHDDSVIGDNVRIDDNVVIGKTLMKAAISATTKDVNIDGAIIGDNSLIGTCAVIYRGAKIGKKVLIADHASVREDVTVGDKTIIGKNSTIENKVSIGNNVKIQANVQIVPFSVIEDFVFISPGVMTSNDGYAGRTKRRFKEYKGITVKKGARLGVACITLPGVTINEDALVGAGALVTKDVPAGKIVVGTPAKVLRDVPEDQLLENQ